VTWWLRRASRSVLVTLVALMIGLGPSLAIPQPKGIAAASASAWTVYHHDDGHTGDDSTLPEVSTVNTGRVSGAMDAQVYASALVYNGLVYAATLNNSVYAFNQASGALVWQVNLGAPETSGWSCGNVAPQGILVTPVIDVAGGRIYVAALLSTDVYWVFGLDLATGRNQAANPDPKHDRPGDPSHGAVCSIVHTLRLLVRRA